LDEIGGEQVMVKEDKKSIVDFNEMERRLTVMKMNVYTGEMIPDKG